MAVSKKKVYYLFFMILQRGWKKYREILNNYRSGITMNETLEPKEGGRAIAQALQSNNPYLAGRMGWMETYITGKLLTDKETTLALREKLELHAGVFPPTSQELNLFSATYLEAAREVDILGLMKGPFEGWHIKAYLPQAERIALEVLEPYLYSQPWSEQLEGKTVLVVHPFEKSIAKQYETVREKIFSNPKILPKFILKTIKAPQTIAGNSREYHSWSETLKELEKKVKQENFDVAILGCGAYGLPLGASIKKMGKIAIHLGGATQLLFGISGGRWKNHQKFQKLINDSWSSPLEEERPHGWEKIEGGAYW